MQQEKISSENNGQLTPESRGINEYSTGFTPEDMTSKEIQGELPNVGGSSDDDIMTSMPKPVYHISKSDDSSRVKLDEDDKSDQSDSKESLSNKEWVAEAKAVISETEGDPHRREYKVNDLKQRFRKQKSGKK